MEIKLRPFAVPATVRIDIPVAGEVCLRDVPASDLAALCDQFRADVFKAVGKKDPVVGIVDTDGPRNPCSTCEGKGITHAFLTAQCPDCGGTGRAK